MEKEKWRMILTFPRAGACDLEKTVDEDRPSIGDRYRFTLPTGDMSSGPSFTRVVVGLVKEVIRTVSVEGIIQERVAVLVAEDINYHDYVRITENSRLPDLGWRRCTRRFGGT